MTQTVQDRQISCFPSRRSTPPTGRKTAACVASAQTTGNVASRTRPVCCVWFWLLQSEIASVLESLRYYFPDQPRRSDPLYFVLEHVDAMKIPFRCVPHGWKTKRSFHGSLSVCGNEKSACKFISTTIVFVFSPVYPVYPAINIPGQHMNMGTAPSKSVGKKEKDENRNRLPLFFKITPKHEVKTEDSDAPTVLRVCLIGLSTSLPEWPDFASNFAPDKDGWYKM